MRLESFGSEELARLPGPRKETCSYESVRTLLALCMGRRPPGRVVVDSSSLVQSCRGLPHYTLKLKHAAGLNSQHDICQQDGPPHRRARSPLEAEPENQHPRRPRCVEHRGPERMSPWRLSSSQPTSLLDGAVPWCRRCENHVGAGGDG